MTITLATSRLDARLAQVAAALQRVREERRALLPGPREGVPPSADLRRARLLLASAEICGGATEDSVSLAAVVEVMEDSLRRHETVTQGNAAAGKRAVMAGDYLMVRAFDLLPAEDRGYWTVRLAELMRSRYASRLQELSASGPLAPADRVRLARASTGAAYRFCAEAGTRTAAERAEAETTAALLAFGEHLGTAVHLEAVQAGCGRDLPRGFLEAAREALALLPDTPARERLLALAEGSAGARVG